MQRCTVYYTGQVQGVGFRYTTRRIAGGYRVSGYVRNLADGRVEMVVEGEADELARMLEEVAGTMRSYIRDVAVDRSVASGQFLDFSVRYG